MTITKIGLAVERSERSDSLDTQSGMDIKNGEEQINKTNHSQQLNLLTSKLQLKPKLQLKSKPKPKPKSKPIVIKHSSLTSDSNPLTISRRKKIEKGEPLVVHWDDKIIIHEIRYWDPCGKTFTDDCVEKKHVECIPQPIAKKKSNKKSKKYFFFSKKKPANKNKNSKKKKNSKVAAFVFVVSMIVALCI